MAQRGLCSRARAGIGKTILWQAAVEEAGRRAERVLACRGVG